ncbi:TonB-dependent receptor [Roseisolibacter sp. H3M3-2]|uniref:TonB-dependent receptor n=1 Tax=Roseisolibacter sp. H3M3-2 TaxID=3031323 RepID=UPI0023DB3C23|nr:TonB-dependent receptor [Roseisolibacter sp. H3M3-2]MDF1502541.1 TonB-dependent receptor [Roseisolibacter sp. H3M3-2]
MSPRRPPSPLVPLACAVAASVAVAPAALRAQQVDVIRGRITGPDSASVEGAVVQATSISGNVTRSARTDRQGRFTITFPNGDGDYMVTVAAVGYAQRRFEVKRTADQEILVADARLQSVSTVLDAVRIQAPRDRVSRNDQLQPDIGGSERAIANAAATVPADQLGDLAAMAASLPGVQLVPGQDGGANGFSVLGLGADQNNTTLNGMNFGGGNLPRDAAVSSSLSTSPYDVSRGGFSGAQFGLRTRGGSNFVTRGMSLNLDAPQLQWTDRAARALGQQYTNLSLGGLVSGPIRPDQAFYSLSYQLGRRANDFQNLLNTGALGLQSAGVAADSAARLLSLLDQARVPTTVGGLPGDRLSDNGTVFGAIDFSPPSSTRGQSMTLTFNGGWNRQRPMGGAVTDVPAFTGERSGWNGGLQARHSSYATILGVGVLTETTLGASAGRSTMSPFLDLPGARVRVNSQFADGTTGVQNLGFGGSPMFNAVQENSTVGYMNQLSWFSADNKHRLKFTSELRRDGYAQDQRANYLGSFAYNSLADLQAGRPASYSRLLTPRASSGGLLVGAVSLGDAFRYSNDLQLQYGVRLDANRFLADPQRNPEVERLFGARNDRTPDRVYVSPRLGFSWQYGQAPQIPGFEGAVRGPRAVVRGGVGVFQGLPGAQQVSGMLENTGLAGAVQQLSCVGAATPTADWSAWAANAGSVPTTCVDGTTGSVFANAAPNVSLFARDFAAARSLRSNLQWSGPLLDNRLTATVDGTYSRNLNQPGTVDLNFAPTQQFVLVDEGGRPVYARPASIVPLTGAIAGREARVSQDFARVGELRSDLRSESRQLQLRVNPSTFSAKFLWSAAYTYSNVREQVRGFSSTAGNPLDVEWARGSFDSRHQVQYTLGYNFWDAVRVNWFGQFRSGLPFTPTIAGDVNGDGYANDRAFVFDPARTSDPAVASAMQQLLGSGPAAARDCLRRQVGALAGRNSCQGPWTSSAILSLTFNPVKFRMPQRATVSLQVSNPLGAADMLLNGEDGLKGWGQQNFPDQSLLYVRGFDPQTQRYRYEVNQRFGETSPQRSAFRAPVTVTAMMRFDVGPTRERQLLTQQLDRGRRTNGTKAPEQLLRAMYAGGGIPNPMATILRQQDSLRLTGPQADSIATLNRWFTIRSDSIWTPVTKYLGALPDDYDHGAAYDRWLRARQASIDLLARLAPHVRGLLTADQHRRLPAFVAGYLEPRYLASIRSGTASFTGGGMMMGGGGGQVMMGGGGGGGVERVIIRQ